MLDGVLPILLPPVIFGSIFVVWAWTRKRPDNQGHSASSESMGAPKDTHGRNATILMFTFLTVPVLVVALIAFVLFELFFGALRPTH